MTMYLKSRNIKCNYSGSAEIENVLLSFSLATTPFPPPLHKEGEMGEVTLNRYKNMIRAWWIFKTFFWIFKIKIYLIYLFMLSQEQNQKVKSKV